METPQGEEEESVPSFSVPTQNDPPAVYEGINMVNLGSYSKKRTENQREASAKLGGKPLL